MLHVPNTKTNDRTRPRSKSIIFVAIVISLRKNKTKVLIKDIFLQMSSTNFFLKIHLFPQYFEREEFLCRQRIERKNNSLNSQPLIKEFARV